MKKALIIIAAIVVIGGGAWLIFGRDNNKSTNNNTTASQPASSTSTDQTSGNSTNQTAADQVTITYGSDGFSPNTVTVKKGGTVTVKNTSSSDLQFDSNPHPAHTDNTELNLGTVSPGQSQSFVVQKTGTFGYHNHLNPSDTGTIIVQ